MYNKHLCISLVAILIIINFAFYSIDVQNSSSQISSFSKNNNDVETEELRNAKIKRFPKAIIIGAPKCGNKIIKQNNFNIEYLNSRHKWVANTNWYSSKDQKN
jgi:hypothetical protein